MWSTGGTDCKSSVKIHRGPNESCQETEKQTSEQSVLCWPTVFKCFPNHLKPVNDGIKTRRQSQECSLPSTTRRGCRKTSNWADWLLLELSVFKFIRIDVSGQHQSRTSAPPSQRSFIYILAARTLMTPPRPSCGYFLPTPPTLNALIIGCSSPLIDAFRPSIQVFLI